MLKSLFSFAVAVIFCATPVAAADLQSNPPPAQPKQCPGRLENVQGEVFVNRGAGFSPASSNTTVRAGDTVLANDGGTAVVGYADGTSTPVVPGNAVRVPYNEPCGASAFDPLPLLWGAAVVGGITAAIVLSQRHEGEHPPPSPISP